MNVYPIIIHFSASYQWVWGRRIFFYKYNNEALSAVFQNSMETSLSVNKWIIETILVVQVKLIDYSIK